MTYVRHLLVPFSFLIFPSSLFCAQIVYPAAQTNSKIDVLPQRKPTRNISRPAWSHIPENVIIRGANDPSPLTLSRLPQESTTGTSKADEIMIDESALFGPSRYETMPPPPPEDEDSDDSFDISFDDPDEMLSSLGQVFQLDEEAMDEIKNFDFSALANIDFGDEDDLFSPDTNDGEDPSGAASFNSFNQFGDFSSLFGQE